MNWYKLAFKNIFRNKRRSFLTSISISTVVGVLVFMGATIQGMQDDLIRNIKDIKTGDFYIEHKNYQKYKIFSPLDLLIDKEDIKPLLEKSGLKISENLDFPLSLYKNSEMNFVQGLAFSMDVQQEKIKNNRSVFKIYGGTGRLPQTNREVAVGISLADKYNIKVGDRIPLLAQTVSKFTNGVSYTVTAIVQFSVSFYNSSVVFDIKAAQQLLKTDQVLRVLAYTGNDEKTSKLIQQMKPELEKKDYIVKAWYQSADADIIGVQKKIDLIVTIIFSILGGSIIINTAAMGILERRKEIGMMSSLGVQQKEIQFLFFIESIWIGVAGALLGIIVSTLITLIYSHTGLSLGESIAQESGLAISQNIYPRVTLDRVLNTFFISLIINVIISYLPTGKISKIPPAEAFRL